MKSEMMLQIRRWKLSSHNRFYSGKGNRRGLQKKLCRSSISAGRCQLGTGFSEECLWAGPDSLPGWLTTRQASGLTDEGERKKKLACPSLPWTLWKLLGGASVDRPWSSRVPALGAATTRLGDGGFSGQTVHSSSLRFSWSCCWCITWERRMREVPT